MKPVQGVSKASSLYAGLPLHFRRMLRVGILLFADSLCLVAAFYISLNLRFDWRVPPFVTQELLRYLHWFLLTYLGTMLVFRQYRLLWRYATGRELLIQAVILLLAGGLTLLINGVFAWGASRAVLVGACLFTIGLVTANRLFARSVRSRMNYLEAVTKHPDGRKSLPVMIVGAGEAASFILTQNRRAGSQYGQVLALVDDAPEKQNMRVQNVPVMGRIKDVPALVTQLGIREIIIAMPSVKGERLQQIVEICNATRCQVRIMSDPQDIDDVKGSKGIILREPNLADFLSRDEVRIDDDRVGAYLWGKVVLVTGGGGSIGSEICRQVMEYAPEKLLIFDIYENCAYELLMELQRKHGRDCPVTVLVGSVRDTARLDEVMAAYHPQVIFHAAAHKHVPLMEISPTEAVKNNVFGTMNVMQAGEKHGAERFVMLSTDKAVNPTSVMGATKRVAEIAMQLFSRSSRIHCSAVRFGNVLGSHGSVIPLFEAQIRAGGPVTLTHPDIIRFFMTIPEAASLVLQAGSMNSSGRIYVLDMGEPVRIVELAEKLIRFYGFDPQEDMPIQITGLRPGEKLYEELMLDEEQSQMESTYHEKIMVAPPLNRDPKEVEAALMELKRSITAGSDAVESALLKMLPNFKHMCNEKELESDSGCLESDCGTIVEQG